MDSLVTSLVFLNKVIFKNYKIIPIEESEHMNSLKLILSVLDLCVK